MKRIIVLLIALLWVLPLICTAEEETKLPFTIRAADFETDKVALTMDDCYDMEQVQQAVEICKKYGVTITFFPLGEVLSPDYRDVWQSALDAGCEIGSHSFDHRSFPQMDPWSIISSLGRTQQALDETLGYHYEIRWLRPPYGQMGGSADGKIKSDQRIVSAIKKYGYEHIVKWNVSQTDPVKAMAKIKAGTIALYHSNKKDNRCLDTIIPQLLEKGLTPVTLSEMLGFDPPETGDELYVFDKKDYQAK